QEEHLETWIPLWQSLDHNADQRGKVNERKAERVHLDVFLESAKRKVFTPSAASVVNDRQSDVLGGLVDRIVANVSKWRLDETKDKAHCRDGRIVAVLANERGSVGRRLVGDRNHSVDALGRVRDFVEHVF